jgi:hypothetical protein
MPRAPTFRPGANRAKPIVGLRRILYLASNVSVGKKFSVGENFSVPRFKNPLKNWPLDLASGVDVMITIFCDLFQFSATKLAFFSKTNVMIKFFHNLTLFRVINAIFC